MKYYLIAGEASGDLHGANLMKAIASLDEDASFRFWGGDKMAALPNSTQVEHYKNTAFMGFLEVLKHLPKIFSYIKKCKQDILSNQPDVVIFIDYPGFNLRIADFAKKAGFKTTYYISPQVWAWKERRVLKIKRYVEQMLVILPFEKEFYKKWNYEVDFVGHPLLDEIKNQNYPLSRTVEKPIIALLPGSRKQEITAMLPLFLSIEKSYPEYQFVVAGLSHIEDRFYQKILKEQGSMALVLKNENYAILQAAQAAMVASGTATLETALFEVPMLVAYRGSWLSYQIGRRLIKVPFISLVNLIMKKKVLEELIQSEFNKQNLKVQLDKLFNAAYRAEQISAFIELKSVLGKSGASQNAAQLIVNRLKK